MVTLVAGAVAVGIVSVCAIPFGCFISRKLKKKVLIPPEVKEPLSFDEPGINPASESNPEEVADESEYQVEEVWARPNKGRVPRVEIRVLFSNGSSITSDVPSQGYITASASSSSSASKESRRLSLQNLAAGPAADRQNEARSSSSSSSSSTSLPIDVRMGQFSSQQVSQSSSDSTRFEITISGAFPKSVAQFGEFGSEVPESSTPKSKSNSSDEPEMQTSSFWRRGPSSRKGQPKVFKTTRGIEAINVEVVPDDELPRRRDPEPHLATEAKAKGNCRTRNESRKPELEAKVSSQGNGAPAVATATACDRGRWGIPSRFFESFRETTSFVTL